MKKFFAFIFLISLLFAGSILHADDTDFKIIKKIDVKGNISVNQTIILSHIKSKQGDLFLRDMINEDLRRLYNLGYFSDISIDVEDYEEGVNVTFVVVEKFSIKSIDISGNRVIKKDKLFKDIDVKPGQVFNKKYLQEVMKKIEQQYIEKGFYNVKTDLKVKTDIVLHQVDLVIQVNENKRVYVKKIAFSGNLAVKDTLLKKQMKTKEKWWFGAGYFNDEILEEDIEKLKAYYRALGYMNVKMSEPEITYDEIQNYVYIILNIEEGPCYYTGIVEIRGNELFPSSEIMGLLRMREGSIFSQDFLMVDQRTVQSYYAERGYFFAIVRPSTYINPNNNIIDITYTITENDLAYIERIIIQGNLRTKDKVIRRNLLVRPLEPFDGKKLKRSQEKLQNLNYFETIDFETESGTRENYRDLFVNVKEKKTGEFSFGGGYSSVDGVVGFVEIGQNNFDITNFPTFIGGGQKLRLRAEIGGSTKSYELSFTEPWLMDKPLSSGFDIYNRKWDRSEYDEERKGYKLRFGYPVGKDNYFSLMYKQEKVDIEVTNHSTIDPEILQEQGEMNLRSMTYTLSRDTRDNINFPKKGYKYILSAEPTGGLLGGDVDLVRYYGSANHYYEFPFDNWVFEAKGRLGTIDRFDDTERVPVYERFFAGGASTIRGYKERAVGPRGVNLDPIGGSSMVVLNAEMTFPLMKIIRGAVFADAGNVWDGGNDWDLGDLKKSVGLGVRIKTPFGPVKLDYGFAIDNVDYEDDSRLHFSMGGAF